MVEVKAELDASDRVGGFGPFGARFGNTRWL